MHRLSLEHGAQHPGLDDFLDRDLEQVLIQHDEVRVLASLDGAGDLFKPKGVGTEITASLQHLVDCYPYDRIWVIKLGMHPSHPLILEYLRNQNLRPIERCGC
jgi:hypothetical protein